MPELLEKLSFYLDFPFVRYAIIVGVLVSLCSSLLGVTLVLKRYSYIGDGLSHVAFGALSIAAVLKITNNMLLILPVTIAVAVLLLCTGKNARIKGDAAIAMVSVGALAIGYLLMNVFSTSANISGDVCTTLFGSTSILTLRIEEVYLCVALSIAVLAVFILFYHKIFAITFDENFAQATGVNTTIFNLLIAVIVAVIIVLAMNLVGALLVSALVVFPSLSAMRVFKSFFAVTVASAILEALSRLFVIENQKPFAGSMRSGMRLRKAEKRHFCDPSLAAALMRATPEKLEKDLRTLGFLFEGLVERDLRTYAESFGAELYHYQDYENHEIDAVVELSDGRWAAIEVKLGVNQEESAAAGLKKIAAQMSAGGCAPSALIIVVGLASAAYRRKDGVYVVPITALKP